MSNVIIIPGSSAPQSSAQVEGLDYEPTAELTPVEAAMAEQWASQYAMQLLNTLNSRDVRRSLFRDGRHDIAIRIDAGTRQRYFLGNKEVESSAVDVLLDKMRKHASLASDREDRGLKVFLVDGPAMVFTVQQ